MSSLTHAPNGIVARTAAATAAALGALALIAAAAPGNTSQQTIVQDDPQLVRSSADTRVARLDELKGLGVDIVKVRVDWRGLAPEGASKPPGFSGENPDEYAADRWAPYDAVIQGIVDRGMSPYIMLGGRAPDWASSGGGVTRPSADEFKRFVQAVGNRYSGPTGGMYLDPLTGAPGGHPRVTTYSVWNEPNLASWLAPQRDGKGRASSPRIYRDLLYAARDGLVASGHGSDQLLIGELQPRGGASTKVAPVEFLRELGCLDRKYKPYTGSSAKARGCDGFAALPGTGLAYHPYTLSGGPDVHSSGSTDASIRELSRMTSVLDKLYSRKRLQAKRMPIWIAEFGFQTDPPDQLVGSPLKKVPAFMGESEWIAFRNTRVATYSQYPIVDDKVASSGDNRFGGFQSGLRFENGDPKPGVYLTFQQPFYVQLRGSKSVELFGAVRAGAAGQDVTIEQRSGGGGFKALATVKLGAQGYFRVVRKLSAPTKRQYRFRAGNVTSRTATAHR